MPNVVRDTGVRTAIPLATTLGYVAENAATNLCLQSQAFDNVTWTKSNITITADNVAAPDGTLTADRLTDDATSAGHRIYQPLPTLTAVAYTYSAYLKQGTLPWAQLFFADAGSGQFWANFNLATGAVGNKSIGGVAVTTTVTALPNGWYRCSITTPAVTAGGGGFQQVNSINADINSGSPVYVGTGQTMYLWGAQVEQASDPSSYIPTTTVAATRVVEGLGYQTATNIDFALATTYLESYSQYAYPAKRHIGVITTPYQQQFYESNKALSLYSPGGQISGANLRVVGAVNKSASAWSGATASICLNGGAVATGAFVAFPAAGLFALGNGGGDAMQGTIRNVNIYATRLTDAQLIALTA
jgi:hypothetical protein